MISVELFYNSESKKASVYLNDRKPYIGSELNDYSGREITQWVSKLPHDLYVEACGYDFKLDFYGDCESFKKLEEVFKDQIDDKSVILIHVTDQESQLKSKFISWVKENRILFKDLGFGLRLYDRISVIDLKNQYDEMCVQLKKSMIDLENDRKILWSKFEECQKLESNFDNSKYRLRRIRAGSLIEMASYCGRDLSSINAGVRRIYSECRSSIEKIVENLKGIRELSKTPLGYSDEELLEFWEKQIEKLCEEAGRILEDNRENTKMEIVSLEKEIEKNAAKIEKLGHLLNEYDLKLQKLGDVLE